MSINSTQDLINAILRAEKGGWRDRVEFLIGDGTIGADVAEGFRSWGDKMDQVTKDVAEMYALSPFGSG